MRTRTTDTLLLAGLMAVAGCASPVTATPADNKERDMAHHYQVTATVLEDGKHGPQLCGAVAESLPPQCGGPDIIGWDWETVPSESAAGTRWGDYTMVGTWDGERFTLVEPARPAGEQDPVTPEAPDWLTDLSVRELQDIQRRLHEDFELVFASYIDETARIIVAQTWLETEELRSAIDEKFGERVVYLNSMLRPVR